MEDKLKEVSPAAEAAASLPGAGLNPEEASRAAAFYADGIEELRRGVELFSAGVGAISANERRSEEYVRAEKLDGKMRKTLEDFRIRLEEILTTTTTTKKGTGKGGNQSSNNQNSKSSEINNNSGKLKTSVMPGSKTKLISTTKASSNRPGMTQTPSATQPPSSHNG